MNIRHEIITDRSKANILRIVNYIGDDAEQFKILVHLFLHDEEHISQRAIWAMAHSTGRHPQLIFPHLQQLLTYLQTGKPHDAGKRNIVKILSEIVIPEHLQGQVLDICFNYLLSMQEAIAVKSFSMQVVFNISRNEPDLLRELAAVIEEQMPYGSAGYRSRGRNILRAIHKILMEKE